MTQRKVDPALLIVLQPVAWAFYFDQSITLLAGPELNEVWQTATMVGYVLQDAPKKRMQMLGGDARQCQLQQRLVEQAPADEVRLQPELFPKRAADAVTVLASAESAQTFIKQPCPASMEVRSREIGRASVKGVKERTGQRRKDDIPAEQAKQRID